MTSRLSRRLKKFSDEELIEYYLKSRATLSPHTLKNYRVSLTRFFNYCHELGISMTRATEIEVSDFINHYQYKSTKDSYKTILNIFFKWCFKHHLMDQNPAEDIVIKKGKKKKQTLMSELDFKAILSRCEGLREMTIVSMLWFTGIRAKELRMMRIEDIDLERGLIHISNSKTMTGYRTIPIHPNFKGLLKKYLHKRRAIKSPQKSLFLTKKGSSFSESTITHLIDFLQRDLGQSSKFTCHDFRRAFITRLYRKTKDLVLCQNLAGHSSIKTTRTYILDDFEENMRKFNGLSDF
ncbi:MAG: tyrosine-type recombinase/integrase [Candidatus Heimdallarchaeota archaeon]|nr:tyrosine-type recombinase/integrase [Candidatus Heimdallarchaeota archaeon]